MIGVFGGTFDPVHYGHLRPAQEIFEVLELEKLFIVPASTPPHRPAPVASAEQRLQMARLSTSEFRDMTVDDCEILRGGISYTVDTLQYYRQQFPQTPICLLMGSDAFLAIETWHQWQRIPELAHLVVMQRPHQEQTIPPWFESRVVEDVRELSGLSSGKVYRHAVAPQDISATLIRKLIARHEDVSSMLPAAVLEFIQQQHLYE